MQIQWDEDKNISNLSKHGLTFEIAKLVFEDQHSVSTQDRFVDGEERWQTVGLVNGVALLLVAHTWREDDDEVHIRMISARKATAHERKSYENGNT